ncbi:MAG: outer membrane protein assembly factor BamD, partial [Acidobacteriota bacterium]
MLNIRKFAVATGILVIMLSAAGCHHKRPKNAGVVVPVPQLWEKGQKALRKGHTVTARRYFDEISLRNDAGKYKDKAAIATADSYYQEHNIASYAEAITRYQSFLAFHPTSTDAPYCQYMIGQAYLEEVETPDRDVTPAQKAREAFQNLLE